jgi:cytochrome c553
MPHRANPDPASLKETTVKSRIVVVLSSTLVICGLTNAAAQGQASTEVRAATAWLAPPEPAPGTLTTPPDSKTPLHIPGSTQTYTRAQTEAMFVAPDWWPQDHPPMPQIVAQGRNQAWPCAHCHLPTGLGRPEDAATAGLPLAYIVEQIRAFRDGERKSPIMHEEVSHLSDADLQLAAAYFSKLRFTPWTKVIETATVPKMHGEFFMWAPIAGAGREPLGNRIIVTPVNLPRTKLGDTRSGYIAYVPPGSIARGKALATTGDGKTTACIACHGADLRGVGMIPPMAGRMPNYLVHQLIKFQDGERNGMATLPMQQEASKLTLDDMISAAAYAASLKP